MNQHRIKVDEARCIGCEACKKDCPVCHITMKDHKAMIKDSPCLFCGHCEAICPKHAITITGYPQETLQEKQKPALAPEDILVTIRNRRTIRQFQQKKIPSEIIKQILEAGRYTHTAKNMQDVSYIVLDQEKHPMEQIAVKFFRKIKPFASLVEPMAKQVDIHDAFFFFHAPCVIILQAKNTINASLAAQNMEFMAEAHGLGVLYSGYFTMAIRYNHQLRKKLRIETGKKAIITLVIGYPAVNYQRPAHRDPVNVTYR